MYSMKSVFIIAKVYNPFKVKLGLFINIEDKNLHDQLSLSEFSYISDIQNDLIIFEISQIRGLSIVLSSIAPNVNNPLNPRKITLCKQGNHCWIFYVYLPTTLMCKTKF